MFNKIVSYLFSDANKFIKGLPATVDVVEREALTFDVEVKDPELG